MDKIKILETIITNKISLNENCNSFVRKANAKMILLRKIWSFGSTIPEMVELWKDFCGGISERTCPLWASSLTDQNISDLERLQKTFVKLILEEGFSTYQEGLDTLNLNSLKKKRKILTLRLAKTSLADYFFYYVLYL